MSVVGTEIDKLIGLEMGADDNLVRPANPRELLAGVRSVLRLNADGAEVKLRRAHDARRATALDNAAPRLLSFSV